VTADQRLTLILAGIGLLSGLMAWGLRILWLLSASIQEDKDATRANTSAVDRLTDRMGTLAERVAALEGPPRRR